MRSRSERCSPFTPKLNSWLYKPKNVGVESPWDFRYIKQSNSKLTAVLGAFDPPPIFGPPPFLIPNALLCSLDAPSLSIASFVQRRFFHFSTFSCSSASRCPSTSSCSFDFPGTWSSNTANFFRHRLFLSFRAFW